MQCFGLLKRRQCTEQCRSGWSWLCTNLFSIKCRNTTNKSSHVSCYWCLLSLGRQDGRPNWGYEDERLSFISFQLTWVSMPKKSALDILTFNWTLFRKILSRMMNNIIIIFFLFICIWYKGKYESNLSIIIIAIIVICRPSRLGL